MARQNEILDCREGRANMAMPAGTPVRQGFGRRLGYQSVAFGSIPAAHVLGTAFTGGALQKELTFIHTHFQPKSRGESMP